MKTSRFIFSTMMLSAVLSFMSVGCGRAADIRVMNSGGFTAAYRALAPEFEKATGHKLLTAWGPSMGDAPDAIPVRLQRGEHADVLLMVGSALDQLIQQDKVVCDIRVDLAKSGIGMAVRAGAPRPDIGTVEAFKRTLLGAASIAYSDSASGVYLSTVLFKRLGIADRLMAKSKMIEAEPVGRVIARGEAELGFQQISELLPVPGIVVVGPLPPEIQKITLFSACGNKKTREPDAVRALVTFLSSPAAAPAITQSGMEPFLPAKNQK
jgi:molybdate transport system substrate-binding protein